MNFMGELDIVIDIIRTFFILLFSLYIFIKFANIDRVKHMSLSIIMIVIVSTFAFFIRQKYDEYVCAIIQLISVLIINIINYKKGIGNTIINTIISFGISYLLFYVAIIIFSIPSKIFYITDDSISLICILAVYSLLVWRVFKIKKIKNGIIFLQTKMENEILDLLLLNISSIIIFIGMIISGGDLKRHIALTIFIFTALVFITIKKSLDQYYKHKLLLQDLDATKSELDEKNKKIEELESEILNFSETSHSLAHKQRKLEYKINKMTEDSNSRINKELGEELESLSKELYNKQVETELSKTDIPQIDDMLEYMQSEAVSKNIDFELQILGNIHYMTNHFVTKDELEILLADHIKDAIIAIENSENINRSILVKLGKVEDCYGIYFYDSGIEFTKEVLENLGKKPITTHESTGGTGMGYMNTFKTLRKYNASLIIKEFGLPNKDDFTKVVMIKFDNKNEFKTIQNKKEVPA